MTCGEASQGVELHESGASSITTSKGLRSIDRSAGEGEISVGGLGLGPFSCSVVRLEGQAGPAVARHADRNELSWKEILSGGQSRAMAGEVDDVCDATQARMTDAMVKIGLGLRGRTSLR